MILLREKRMERTKFNKKTVKREAVKPCHSDECLIVLRMQYFLPWGQLQGNQCALGDFPIPTTLLLNGKTVKEVLPVAGVLNPDMLLLLFPVTKG
jgi:hypothetical protein